jgi:hypothetical protein
LPEPVIGPNGAMRRQGPATAPLPSQPQSDTSSRRQIPFKLTNKNLLFMTYRSGINLKKTQKKVMTKEIFKSK